MTALRADFLRCSSRVAGGVALVILIGHLLGQTPIDITLIIPIVFCVLFIWFAFVPEVMEYSDRQFHVRFCFRRDRLLLWSDLRHYGPGQNVFLLQFGSEQAIQICATAYRPAEWKTFIDFLKNTYPDRKADIWIGPFGHSWPWKKRTR